jgi:hypothetical protein
MMKLILPSNKKFGSFFTVIFLLVGMYSFYLDISFIAYLSLSISACFLIISLTKSKLLYPLNKAWMSLGFLLGKIINPIIMGLIFFGIFTPISLFFKVFGRDELALKLKKKKSYWKDKQLELSQSHSFNNQF